jgi:tRNA(fMet)-specific endonuclease VapC
MKPIVLDTDVVSFLFKGDTRAQIFLPHLENRQWLVSLARFAIVPSSRDLVLKWAEVMASTRRGGRRIETADAWIAATALLYDCPLLTHNRADYLGVPGLRLLD